MPSQRFLQLLQVMEDVHRRKNAGYAGQESLDPWANFRMAEMINISPFKGCLVRMGDKYARICNLTKNPDNEQVGEDITQTLLDLAVYCLIAICLYEEESEGLKKPSCTVYVSPEDAESFFGICENNMLDSRASSLTKFMKSLEGKTVKVIAEGESLGTGIIVEIDVPGYVFVRFPDGTKTKVSLSAIELVD